MNTYSELYEKIKPEMEAANQPFKEYKKVRRTFTELFEDKETPEKLDKSYNNLYGRYQVEQLEPLCEQEIIYLIAKAESGEKLTEAELQKLDEKVFTGNGALNWKNWNWFGLNGARNQAAKNSREKEKQNKFDANVNKFENKFANESYPDTNKINTEANNEILKGAFIGRQDVDLSKISMDEIEKYRKDLESKGKDISRFDKILNSQGFTVNDTTKKITKASTSSSAPTSIPTVDSTTDSAAPTQAPINLPAASIKPKYTTKEIEAIKTLLKNDPSNKALANVLKKISSP